MSSRSPRTARLGWPRRAAGRRIWWDQQHVPEGGHHADLAFHLRHEVAGRDHDLGFGVGQDVRDFPLAEQEDQRDDHCAALQDGPVALHDLRTIRQQDDHAVAGADPQTPESVGQPRCRPVLIHVGVLAALERERGVLPEPVEGLVRQAAQCHGATGS